MASAVAAAGIFDGIGKAIGGIFAARAESKARIAEAEGRAKEARAKADIEIAEKQRLKAEYEENSKQKLKEMEVLQAKQEAEALAAREKEEQEHKERLKEMERVREEKNKELKIKQKNDALNECKNEILKYETNIKEARESLTNVTEKQSDIKEKVFILDEKIENFEVIKKRELESLSEKIGLVKARLDLARVDNEVSKAIELTAVHEDNVARFLTLILTLTDATMANQEKANYLSAELETFSHLIKREATAKLTIEQYFNDASMDRFVPILAKEDYRNMNDLICKGDEKDEEFDDIMETIETGLKKEYKQWENEKKRFEENPENKEKNLEFEMEEPIQELKKRHKRFMKRVCFQPEEWQSEQNLKINQAIERLDQISHPMARFFSKIHVTMKEVQHVLEFSNTFGALTNEQIEAIQWARNEEPKRRQLAINDSNISMSNSNDSKEDINDAQIESNISKANQTYSDIVINGTKDEKEQNLELMKQFDENGRKHFEQSLALTKAATLKINISEAMRNEFDGSPNGVSAMMLAKGIERTCMEIIRNMGQIRQSLLLAHCILEMKPANLNGKSKQLWDAVDSGIIQIYKNALEMSKVTANYFGFFCKFEASFNYYLACTSNINKNGNENENDSDGKKAKTLLMLSTEHLQTDVKDFGKLSVSYGKQVSILGDSALKCIENCVRNMAGAKNFDKNRSDREKKLTKYLEKKKVYDEKQLAFDADYDRLLNERAELKAQDASMEFVCDSLKKQLDHDTKMKLQTQETMDKLNQILV